ncbi:GEM-like protein 1 isoform X2 [Macadamia integrifolia]|uniref:GEM-like protein 1 isoform X2 n=1 Tax=Macadamia integrifolia TaxID=60698 RepID=UPI001C4E8395|nr:GEM-like protein 1 isoform X2 [Macadamia integrifolia]
MDPYRQNGKENKKMDEGTSNLNTEGRWGSWVMGNPSPPQAHPANQKAGTWVAGEAIPSSDPATHNANYMNYSVPPVTNGNVGGGYGGSSMPRPANPYVQTSPGSSGKGPMDTVLNVLSRCGKKVEGCAKKADGISGNVWNHLKTSPSLSDAAMARLSQGTKVFAEGGREKVFQQTFQLFLDEKLLKAYACYLSSSSGPVIGTLYISNKRVAFCSDNPLCYYPTPGQKEWLYYKAVPARMTFIYGYSFDPEKSSIISCR